MGAPYGPTRSLEDLLDNRSWKHSLPAVIISLVKITSLFTRSYGRPSLWQQAVSILPYDVPANEYLNSYGRKFSKSRGTMISISDVLDRYEPDAWRYTLTALAPEGSDVDFTWDDFVEKVNNELVANWGNLANRMLGFAYKKFGGKVPTPGSPNETFQLDQVDRDLLAEIGAGFESVGGLYEAVHLKQALEECRRLSQKVNQYLNDRAPWTTIKTDEANAAKSVYVALQCIEWLATMWAPILPFSSQKILTSLGYQESTQGDQFTEEVSDQRYGSRQVLRFKGAANPLLWQQRQLVPGQAMEKPSAPFAKLDPDLVKAETEISV